MVTQETHPDSVIANSPEPKPRRKKRTPEQMLADLQEQAERVKRQMARAERLSSDHGKAFNRAVKALERAKTAADVAGDGKMAEYLDEALSWTEKYEEEEL